MATASESTPKSPVVNPPLPEGTLAERLAGVKTRIAEAAARVGRDPANIILVAVTKYASMDQIRELVALGHQDLGENRVQQLSQRSAQLDEYLARHRELGRTRSGSTASLPETVRWHMIGNLQRNKVRKALPLVRLTHSVDSLRLAEEIQTVAARSDDVAEVLIEVNVSGEKAKHGVAPAAARHVVDQMDTMVNIRVRGLMCMAPIVEDPNDARPYFDMCRELFEDIRKHGDVTDKFNILSMGMSSDYEVAIECGANVVRVGSAIFGERSVDAAVEADE